MLTVAALLVAGLMLSAVPGFAKVECTTTFEKGVETTTCVQGSHGTETSQHGKGQGSGEFIGTEPCKATGSEQTNTCP
jgi:hypothetical protein